MRALELAQQHIGTFPKHALPQLRNPTKAGVAQKLLAQVAQVYNRIVKYLLLETNNVDASRAAARSRWRLPEAQNRPDKHLFPARHFLDMASTAPKVLPASMVRAAVAVCAASRATMSSRPKAMRVFVPAILIGMLHHTQYCHENSTTASSSWPRVWQLRRSALAEITLNIPEHTTGC